MISNISVYFVSDDIVEFHNISKTKSEEWDCMMYVRDWLAEQDIDYNVVWFGCTMLRAQIDCAEARTMVKLTFTPKALMPAKLAW
jgi:hypothetical protein